MVTNPTEHSKFCPLSNYTLETLFTLRTFAELSSLNCRLILCPPFSVRFVVKTTSVFVLKLWLGKLSILSFQVTHVKIVSRDFCPLSLFTLARRKLRDTWGLIIMIRLPCRINIIPALVSLLYLYLHLYLYHLILSSELSQIPFAGSDNR